MKGILCLYLTPKFVDIYSYLERKAVEVCQPVSVTCGRKLLRLRRIISVCQIDGMASFSLPLSMAVNYFFVVYGIGPESLELNATVTEQGTIVSYNTSEILTVAIEPYTISFFPGTRSFFKSGLPFFARVSTKCSCVMARVSSSVFRRDHDMHVTRCGS